MSWPPLRCPAAGPASRRGGPTRSAPAGSGRRRPLPLFFPGSRSYGLDGGSTSCPMNLTRLAEATTSGDGRPRHRLRWVPFLQHGWQLSSAMVLSESWLLQTRGLGWLYHGPSFSGRKDFTKFKGADPQTCRTCVFGVIDHCARISEGFRACHLKLGVACGDKAMPCASSLAESLGEHSRKESSPHRPFLLR